MYNKVLGNFLGLILAGLALAPWALAQPMAQPMGQPSNSRSGGFQARFQEVKRSQMGPALGVSQPTVDRLLQVEQRYQPQRQALIRDMKMDYQRLQQVMSQPSPSEPEVKAILSNMKRKKQEMQDLQNRQGEEEDALLTPVQQARYIMYLKTLVQEARSVKGRGPEETAPMMPQGPREIPVSRPPR